MAVLRYQDASLFLLTACTIRLKRQYRKYSPMEGPVSRSARGTMSSIRPHRSMSLSISQESHSAPNSSHLQGHDILIGTSHQAGNLFRRPDVGLGNDLGLAIDPCDLTHIEVGSSLLGLYVEMSHADTINSRVFHVNHKIARRLIFRGLWAGEAGRCGGSYAMMWRKLLLFNWIDAAEWIIS